MSSGVWRLALRAGLSSTEPQTSPPFGFPFLTQDSAVRRRERLAAAKVELPSRGAIAGDHQMGISIKLDAREFEAPTLGRKACDRRQRAIGATNAYWEIRQGHWRD